MPHQEATKRHATIAEKAPLGTTMHILHAPEHLYHISKALFLGPLASHNGHRKFLPVVHGHPPPNLVGVAAYQVVHQVDQEVLEAGSEKLEEECSVHTRVDKNFYPDLWHLLQANAGQSIP